MNPTTSRRSFVRQFTLGSAAVLVGSRSTYQILAEVTPAAPGSGVLRIKPSSIPVLANPGGSVQLKFSLYNAPLTLNRVSASRFVTLDSVCTHAGCTVGPFFVDDNRMECPCHGSRYDIEGRVFRDANGNSTEPARRDLACYQTSYDEPTDIISISIPGLLLQIDAISVHQTAENGQHRLKLVFPATFGAIYEIYHQPNFESPRQIKPFSLTPDGAATQTSLGPSVSGKISAYVDATGPSGFFTVGLKLTPPT